MKKQERRCALRADKIAGGTWEESGRRGCTAALKAAARNRKGLGWGEESTLKSVKTASRTWKDAGARAARPRRSGNASSPARRPLALRQKASFPMIGKYFSNGWKIRGGFPMIGKKFQRVSNDWKNVSGEENGQTITTIFDNFECAMRNA